MTTQPVDMTAIAVFTALFVLVTLFLPRGLVGLLSRLQPALRTGDALPAPWTHGPGVGASAGNKAK